MTGVLGTAVTFLKGWPQEEPFQCQMPSSSNSSASPKHKGGLFQGFKTWLRHPCRIIQQDSESNVSTPQLKSISPRHLIPSHFLDTFASSTLNVKTEYAQGGDTLPLSLWWVADEIRPGHISLQLAE